MKAQHFLIADDQLIIRNLVRAALSRLGARSLSFADSGEEALRVLSRLDGSITFVIADWSMGRVDGLQLLKKVRTGAITGVRREMPFIMLTSYSVPAIITAAANLDVSAFLVKPVSALRLEEAIRFAIARPLIAKPASYYERIETVGSPDSSDAPDEAVPAPAEKDSDSARATVRPQNRNDAEE